MVVPIEIVSWLAKPFSLAIRLFANMMAGHQLIAVFVGMTIGAHYLLKPLPYVGAVVMSCFEVFVCFIQAFIFAMLSSLYIKEALDANH
jgi:F-type H+-transporting ATPase subunit a